jgi:hypothetical protein
LYASITESKDKKGEYGIEVSNTKEVLVPWSSLKAHEDTDHTLRDVLLLMGFDTVGVWSYRNKVSRVTVRSVRDPRGPGEPLETPEPEASTFLE